MLSLLLLAWVATCSALLSAPAIPTLFYAEVRFNLQQDGGSWTGGGIYALDLANGKSHLNVRLANDVDEEDMIFLHTLDRYDEGATFMLDEDFLLCTKHQVSEKLPNPWAWVSRAVPSSLSNDDVDVWEHSEDYKTYEIAVKKGTNEPVRFVTYHTSKKEVVLTQTMTFLSFNPTTPEEWAFYIPTHCRESNGEPVKLLGDTGSVVSFANANWNCATASCSSRVSAGSPQPSYQCAEFVSRSLAAGGYIPGLTSGAAQSSYLNYQYNGAGYNMLYTTSTSAALGAIGFKKLAASASSVGAGVAVFGNGGAGYFSHTVIGNGNGNNVDAHNNARLNIPVSNDLYLGISACWGPGNSSGNGTTSGGQSTTGGGQTTGGGNGQTSGGNGQTSGGNGQTSGGNGQTSGGNGQTSGGNGQTSGGNGQTSGGNGQTSGQTSGQSTGQSNGQSTGQSTQSTSASSGYSTGTGDFGSSPHSEGGFGNAIAYKQRTVKPISEKVKITVLTDKLLTNIDDDEYTAEERHNLRIMEEKVANKF